jgi:hypothetical protein
MGAPPPQWQPPPQGECFSLLTSRFANTLTAVPVQGQSTVSSPMGPSVPQVNATVAAAQPTSKWAILMQTDDEQKIRKSYREEQRHCIR